MRTEGTTAMMSDAPHDTGLSIAQACLKEDTRVQSADVDIVRAVQNARHSSPTARTKSEDLECMLCDGIARADDLTGLPLLRASGKADRIKAQTCNVGGANG